VPVALQGVGDDALGASVLEGNIEPDQQPGERFIVFTADPQHVAPLLHRPRHVLLGRHLPRLACRGVVAVEVDAELVVAAPEQHRRLHVPGDVELLAEEHDLAVGRVLV
jgi:hypothetical protein